VHVASVERHNSPATVYNFVVEDTHTYFVGTANGGVEAHNGPCPGFTADQQAFRDIVKEASLDGRKAISRLDADVLLDWGNEVGFPGVRGSADDLATISSHWIGGPHIHVPTVGSGHIPVIPW
jgi:hypothetical protein